MQTHMLEKPKPSDSTYARLERSLVCRHDWKQRDGNNLLLSLAPQWANLFIILRNHNNNNNNNNAYSDLLITDNKHLSFEKWLKNIKYQLSISNAIQSGFCLLSYEKQSQVYFLQVWEIKNVHTEAFALNKLNPEFSKEASFTTMLFVLKDNCPQLVENLNLLINFSENAEVNNDNSKEETKV